MTVTEETVGQAICDYAITGRKPRFVLMDKECHENFSKHLIKTIVLFSDGQKGESKEARKVKTMWILGFKIDILSIDTNEHFLEVVG